MTKHNGSQSQSHLNLTVPNNFTILLVTIACSSVQKCQVSRAKEDLQYDHGKLESNKIRITCDRHTDRENYFYYKFEKDGKEIAVFKDAGTDCGIQAFEGNYLLFLD
jgi:hypothetical protein